ncbi:MAG: aldehyde ferredoxin oxidoreductase family protein [Chloroflexi bacterium]|nr:aldehyde ferredoxin oxidoreductase family protein [Chloroflexota bacterium]
MSFDACGYTGKLLRVDLSSGKISVEPLNMAWARQYIGCQGLGVRYLFEELAPGIDPLGPESKIVLLTGPLTGTIAPCSPKYTLIFKSPLTNILYDSTSGGYFGAELKYAGYDGLIIEGKSPKPVYLLIRDQRVELQDAARIWGKDTFTATDMLKQWWGDDLRVTVIGLAGENQVRFASVLTEYAKANGRAGGGAVFGAKNLKAIAVKGSGSVSVANPEALVELSLKLMAETLVENPEQLVFTGWKGGEGTISIMDWANDYGCLPTRNFQAGSFDRKSKIDAREVKKITKKEKACFSCPMGCAHQVKIEQGQHKGTGVGSFEYESIAMLGSNCDISDLAVVAKLNELCNKHGMDTITAGNVIGWAMDCFERGLLTEKDTNGLPLRFGNNEAAIELLEKIARREGIGALLAEGVARASARVGKGSEEFAMHVKGLEIPAYDPRVAIGMGLAYATAPPGAAHTRAFPISGALFGGWWVGADPVKLDPRKPENFAQVCIQQNHWQAYRFSTGHCDFGLLEPGWKLPELLENCTGWPEIKDWRKIGERIINTYRLFSIREGISRKDDTLPAAFFKKPLPAPAEGAVISPEDFEFMLNEYYELRGWDHEGRPTQEKLRELGIQELGLKIGVR